MLALWGLTTPTWFAMWSILGVLTLVFVVLLRTRWSTNGTWRMCAVLSIWVHVLIIVFSMTIRIVSGPPVTGDGGPIHVAVLSPESVAEKFTDPKSSEIEPIWEQVEAPALVAPEAEPFDIQPEAELEESITPDAKVMEDITKSLASAVPLPSFEAPDLMPAPSTEAPKAEEPKESIKKSKDRKKGARKTEGESQENETGKRESHSIVKTTKEPTQEAIPELYADRFAKDLTEIAKAGGGSSQTEAAVKAALAWLALTQSANGGWDASKYGAGQERAVLGHNRQGAGAEADTGVTGLAILAFLGSGHSHVHGTYRSEVARALEFLRQQQRSDGSLFGEAELFARTYCHAMATLAACEAYAMTRDERLDSMCRAAVNYSLSMQHPTDGGWRYRRGDMGDTSQLGWQLMALKSAQLAGIQVPELTWARAERFLRRVKRGQHGGLAAYRPDSPPSRTMTAEAWFCHQLLQIDRGGSLNPAAIREAIESLEQETPSPSNRNLYYWYYATLALKHNQYDTPEDASSWDKWNHALTTALISTQENDGSWDADTVWGGYGGKVYTTALSALCLEVYYRYHSQSEPSNLAERDGWQSIQR